MQKLLNLIIVGAIIYMLVQAKIEHDFKNKFALQQQSQQSLPQKTASLSDTPVLEGGFIEKTLSSVLINVLKTEEGKLFFENIIRPMNKSALNEDGLKLNNIDIVKSMLQVREFGDGDIGPASCGHIVTVLYKIMDAHGNVSENSTKTFQLGTQPIMIGLDSVVVGMMIGQSRDAVLPAKYSYRQDKKQQASSTDEKNIYKVHVELKNILPHNFALPNEVKIFDDEISYKIPLICGDIATYHAKITKLSNGKVIYNSAAGNKHIHMQIGDVTYPMIFSHALFGKIPTGTRTVIAKGKLYKSLATGVSSILAEQDLLPDEYFMLELSDFQQN